MLLLWSRTKRKLFDKSSNTMKNAPFYRLNVINDYNMNMNNGDIADQLRGNYGFDHSMRKTKWWWSMFFWCFQMLLTNSYITYKKYMELHDETPMSHYEFRKKITLA